MDQASTSPQSNLGIYPSAERFTCLEGKSLEIKLDLVNQAASGEFIQLSVRNVPQAWINILPSQFVFLDRGKMEHVTLIVTPTPDSAGSYELKILATRRDGIELVGETSLTLKVIKPGSDGGVRPQTAKNVVTEGHPHDQIGVKLSTTRFTVVPGEECVIPVAVTNLGQVSDIFTLTLESKEIPASWTVIAPAVLELRPGQQQTFQVRIHPPRKSSSQAKLYPLRCKIQSQRFPDQTAHLDCYLTVAAFHKYTVQVAPQQVFTSQPVRVTVNNEGNSTELFEVSWQGDDWPELSFSVLPPPPELATPGARSQSVGATQAHVPSRAGGAASLRVEPGKSGWLSFKVSSRKPPLLGNPKLCSFDTQVTSSDGKSQSFPCAVTIQPLIPSWVLAALFILCLVSMCAVVWLVNRSGNQDNRQQAAVETQVAYSLTQTVVAVQTAAVVPVDSDGDGLLDSIEMSIGTHPGVTDTDMDGLSDGDEVNIHKTDPKIADNDQDGLVDGDEIARGTNPLAADTDADRLKDGDELRLNTDPKAIDTDLDGLLDGDEALTCTKPTKPDTDDDGITDDEDLDPCDRQNPALTQTAAALMPTITPTFTPTPTYSSTPTPTTAPPTLTPTPTVTPVLPGLPGNLLFSSNREGRHQIYQRNMSNGAITRLTVSNGDDTLPSWSPDGSQVVFTSNRDGNLEIYRMQADGTNQVNLTGNPASDSHPAWSPDGEWIAFSTNRDGNDEIYLMRSDGSEVHNISNHLASDTQPFWESTVGINSLSGVIVFVTDRDGNQEVYKMSPDGGGVTNLSNNSARDYQPVLSPTGGRIAFVSERGGNPDIYLMDADGSDQVLLTSGSPGIDESPTWSGDSQWIAYTTNEAGNFEIYVIKSDGSLRYNITVIQADDHDPAWY